MSLNQSFRDSAVRSHKAFVDDSKVSIKQVLDCIKDYRFAAREEQNQDYDGMQITVSDKKSNEHSGLYFGYQICVGEYDKFMRAAMSGEALRIEGHVKGGSKAQLQAGVVTWCGEMHFNWKVDKTFRVAADQAPATEKILLGWLKKEVVRTGGDGALRNLASYLEDNLQKKGISFNKNSLLKADIPSGFRVTKAQRLLESAFRS